MNEKKHISIFDAATWIALISAFFYASVFFYKFFYYTYYKIPHGWIAIQPVEVIPVAFITLSVLLFMLIVSQLFYKLLRRSFFWGLILHTLFAAILVLPLEFTVQICITYLYLFVSVIVLYKLLGPARKTLVSLKSLSSESNELKNSMSEFYDTSDKIKTEIEKLIEAGDAIQAKQLAEKLNQQTKDFTSITQARLKKLEDDRLKITEDFEEKMESRFGFISFAKKLTHQDTLVLFAFFFTLIAVGKVGYYTAKFQKHYYILISNDCEYVALDSKENHFICATLKDNSNQIDTIKIIEWNDELVLRHKNIGSIKPADISN